MAISPIAPRFARQLSDKLQLAFPLLQDPGNRVAADFGVLRTVPEELLEIYRGFGIDLERINGDASGTLPLPASFVIDMDGVIRQSIAFIDHTERQEPRAILQLLQELPR